MSVTGERVTTPERGFNPTWQRHVAAYALCAPLLGPGTVLDLGCGVGHSYHRLAPRQTVGVDIDAGALREQQRQTVVADMRELPFSAGSFESVLSVHSLEHTADPECVLGEVVRVLKRDGRAVFVTPNRLTFARPDEIIDPYHYAEYDPDQLRALCALRFGDVRMLGVFGSARYGELLAEQARTLDALLRKDPLRLRRLIPRRVRQVLYDRRLTKERADHDPRAETIGEQDFHLGDEGLERCLDVVAVCSRADARR